MRAFVIFLLLVSTNIFTQEKKVKILNTDFRFHSQIFFNYSYRTNAGNNNSQGFNNKNNRFYLGFKKNINKIFSVRFTLDVGKNSTNRYGAFMKYGYLNIQFTKGLSLTMGIFLNPIHGFSNKFWGHRYIVSAYGGDYWNAVPQGVILDYQLNKLLRASIFFTNGSTYKYVGDNDKNKDITIFLSLTPIKYLDIVTHLKYIIPIADNSGTTIQGTFFLGYSIDNMFKLGYQFLYKYNKTKELIIAEIKTPSIIKNSIGNVVYVRLMPIKEYEFFGSLLINYPNIEDNNEITKFRAIGGIEYKYSKNLKFALSHESNWTKYEFNKNKPKEYIVWLSSYVNLK